MLSIAKLRVGQEAYQLSGVAQSLDDYYTGAGEAHGRWLGGSAERLELRGDVDPDDLRAVLAGIRPGSGGLSPNGTEIRPHKRRVPGFDLTFKAPKSASVLYAVSDDPRVQGAVIEAGEAAMRSAIAWLERETVRVQRGSHNQAYLARLDPEYRALAGPRREYTYGVVAASFRHRTSRAGDPLLHWHVLVANLVEGLDGRWSAFAHPELYRQARAAGEVFQASFRAELTASLGIEWRPGATVPEIAGVPERIIEVFSKRSAEVDAWLAATGTPDTPEGRQAAVLATRRNKPEVEACAARFDAGWKAEADSAGWGPAHAEGLVAAHSPHPAPGYDDAWRLETTNVDPDGFVETYEQTVDREEWVADVLRRDLTDEHSTFTRVDVTRAVAARQGAGATIETIERLTNAVLASPQTLPVATGAGPERWTSQELAEIETRFLATLAARTDDPAAPTHLVEATLGEHPGLGDDQANAARAIAESRAAVGVLVGPAGTGKTYTLAVIASTLRSAGWAVEGAAPSARAAIELETATGMTTSTLHGLQVAWRRHQLTPGHGMLVIDEAGMADIRTLTDVVTRHVAAGGRVLLAGDHHQLPEISAGGGFAHAARTARTVATLSTNRRQHHTWEHDALRHLRNGDVATAVAAYADHDRVTIAATSHDLIVTAIDHWATAHHDGQRPVLLAGTNATVNALNDACLDHLLATGELADTTPTPFGNSNFRVGERVVVRRNHTLDDHGFVANGHTGTITALDPDAVHVRLDTGSPITLGADYLARGGQLTHAYALTTHRAQGGTWDTAIAVGADALRREAAYVQLSRGSQDNQLLLTDHEHTALLRALTAETERHDHGLDLPDDTHRSAADHLTARWSRSGAKHLAHAAAPDLDYIDRLATTRPLAELEARLAAARYAEHAAASVAGVSRAALDERRDRIIGNAAHLDIGQQVSPTDRHNLGTVIGVSDDGAVTVHFTSRDGHYATRTFDWHDVRIVTPTAPQPRLLTSTRRHHLDRALAQIDTQLADYDRTLASHNVQPGEADRLQRAVTALIDRASHQLAADRPSWLTDLIGTRPDDVAGARTWDDTVRRIATWRSRHHLEPHTPGLGERPEHPHRAREWSRLLEHVEASSLWLHRPDRHQAGPASHREPDELHARLETLDTVLATAPDDVRVVLAALDAGQLTLGDTAKVLADLADLHEARRDWILEHWPHVVEHHEVIQALEAQAPPTKALDLDLDI